MIDGLIVGDPHFSVRAPVCRIDDYEQKSKDKLNQVCKIAVNLGIKDIFFTGDFFNIKSQTWEFIIEIGKILLSYKLNYYTILGNHDIIYNNDHNSYKKTPISVLINFDIIKLLGYVELSDEKNKIGIQGQSAGEIGFWKENENIPMIYIGHYFLEDQYENEDYISIEEIDNMGYDIVILGHDHNPYQNIITKENVKIIRPGSLMRNSSHEYQKTRDVNIIYFNYFDGNFSFKNIKIEIEKNVFSKGTIKKEEKKIKINYNLNFKEINKKTNIYELLNNYNINLDIKKYLKSKFEEVGINE